LRFFGAESAEKRVFAGGKSVSGRRNGMGERTVGGLRGALFSDAALGGGVWKGGAGCGNLVWTRRGTLGAKGYPSSRCSRRKSIVLIPVD